MDSFYGGKLGYSFILRPNPNNENGFWNNLNQVRAGISNNTLKYGDYIVLTEENRNFTSESGKIYRITSGDTPECVGRIYNLSSLTPVIWDGEIENGDLTTSHINFISESATRFQTDLEAYWELEEDIETGDQKTKLGLRMPQPVINVKTIDGVHQLAYNDDKQEYYKPDIILKKEQLGNKVAPFYYNMEVYFPSNSYVGTESDVSFIPTESFRSGDLWMEVYDETTDIVFIKNNIYSVRGIDNVNFSQEIRLSVTQDGEDQNDIDSEYLNYANIFNTFRTVQRYQTIWDSLSTEAVTRELAKYLLIQKTMNLPTIGGEGSRTAILLKTSNSFMRELERASNAETPQYDYISFNFDLVKDPNTSSGFLRLWSDITVDGATIPSLDVGYNQKYYRSFFDSFAILIYKKETIDEEEDYKFDRIFVSGTIAKDTPIPSNFSFDRENEICMIAIYSSNVQNNNQIKINIVGSNMIGWNSTAITLKKSEE